MQHNSDIIITRSNVKYPNDLIMLRLKQCAGIAFFSSVSVNFGLEMGWGVSVPFTCSYPAFIHDSIGFSFSRFDGDIFMSL